MQCIQQSVVIRVVVKWKPGSDPIQGQARLSFPKSSKNDKEFGPSPSSRRNLTGCRCGRCGIGFAQINQTNPSPHSNFDMLSHTYFPPCRAHHFSEATKALAHCLSQRSAAVVLPLWTGIEMQKTDCNIIRFKSRKSRNVGVPQPCRTQPMFQQGRDLNQASPQKKLLPVESSLTSSAKDGPCPRHACETRIARYTQAQAKISVV